MSVPVDLFTDGKVPQTSEYMRCGLEFRPAICLALYDVSFEISDLVEKESALPP